MIVLSFFLNEYFYSAINLSKVIVVIMLQIDFYFKYAVILFI